MAESNILDADIDDLLRDDDDSIAVENIDADAILDDDNDLLNDHSNRIQDPHLHRNASTAFDAVPVEAVKTLIHDSVSIVYPEVVEEQLDYEEDDCNGIKKKQESKVASPCELSTKTTKEVNNDIKKKNERENYKKRFNTENSEFNKSSKYYVNPNFKGNLTSNKSRGPPFVSHAYGPPPGSIPFSYMGPCPYPTGLISPHMQYQINRNPYLHHRGMGPPIIHPGSMIQGPHLVGVPNQPIHTPFQACHQPPPLAIDIRRNQNSLSENLNQQLQLQQQSQFVQKLNLNKNEQNIQSNKAKRPISKSVSPLKKNSRAQGNVKKINTATSASPVLNTLPPVRIGPVAGSSSSTSIVATSSISAPSLAPPAVNINAIVNASLRAPLGLVSKVQQVLPQSKQPQQQPIVLDRVNLSAPFYQNLPNVPPPQLRISGPPLQLFSKPISLRSSVPLNMPMNSLITHSSIMGGNVTSEAVNWSLMVDAFVKKTSETSNGKTIIPSTFRRSSSRSLSYSSRSRSYSGSSYSRSSNFSERNSFAERSRSPRSPVAARSPRSPQPNNVKKRLSNNRYRNQKTSKNNSNRQKKKFNDGGYKRDRTNRKMPQSRHIDNSLENDKELMKDLKHTIECAEAIGLDDEYLKKIAEQKRLREEVAKRKSQKRKENFNSISATDEKTRIDSRRVKAPSPDLNLKRKHDEQQKNNTIRNNRRLEDPISPLRSRRNDRVGTNTNERSNINFNNNRRQEKRDFDKMKSESPLLKFSKRSSLNSKDKRSSEKISGRIKHSEYHENMENTFSKTEILETTNTNSEDSSTGGNNSVKMKAYLAVVVSNVKELENSYKRVTLLSNSVGSTKKIWQTSENTISIIFTKHEHAKQFMLQYHGKIVNGCRLDVSLEKVFLNLVAML